MSIRVVRSDLQKAYGEAYSRQMEALFTANERLGSSVQELLRCRQPQDVLTAESNILAILMQSQLEGTENRIAVARRDYILAVQKYNTERG